MAPLAVWILCSHISTVFFPEFFRTPFQFNGLVLGVLALQFLATLLTIFLVSATYMGQVIRLEAFSCYLKRAKFTFVMTFVVIECLPKVYMDLMFGELEFDVDSTVLPELLLESSIVWLVISVALLFFKQFLVIPERSFLQSIVFLFGLYFLG